MKVEKIDAGINAKKTGEQNFEGIKLNKNALKMPKQLAKDVVELKGKLPNSEKAKDMKYLGQYDTNGSDPSPEEVIGVLGVMGATIAALCLL